MQCRSVTQMLRRSSSSSSAFSSHSAASLRLPPSSSSHSAPPLTWNDFALLIPHLPHSLRRKTISSLSYIIKTSPHSLRSFRSLHALLSAFSLRHHCPLHSSCAAAFRLSSSPPLRPLAQSLLGSLFVGQRSSSLCVLPLQWAEQYSSSFNMHYYALDLVLRAFLNSAMAIEALNVLGRMRSIGSTPSLSALAILLRLLFQKGYTNYAWKVFVEMLAKGPWPTCKTFNAMILGFSKRGLVRIADGLLRVMMGRFHIHPEISSFNILMKAHCVYGKSIGAFKLFDEMLDWGFAPTIVTCNILLDALCKEGRMVEAREFFSAILAEFGIEYNTITYNVLLHGYVKAGQIDKADLVYYEMKEKHLVPDSCTLNILLSGRYKFRKVLEREDNNILNNLIENNNNGSIKVDLLVAKYCWEGELDKAREILRKAIQEGLTLSVFAFNSVITGFSKKGLEQEAFQLYHLMLELNLSPSASTCNALIMVLCNNGDLNNARELLDEMLKLGFCVNTTSFTIYLNACFKARDLNSALNCWNEMEKFGLNPDLVAFSAYINGLSRANCMHEATLAFNEMNKRGIVPNNFTYNSLIYGFCRIGDLTQALKLEERMRKNGLKPDIFTVNILIHGLCTQKRLKVANNLLGQMQNYGFAPDLVTYNTFINTYCSVLDTARAINYLNKMLLNGFVPDLYTYNIWIHYLCNSQLINPAMKILHELESIGLTPNSVTFNTLMNGICREVSDRAMILTGKLIKIAFKPNVVTLNLILSHFCKQGMYKKALCWAFKLREISFIFDDITRNIIDRAEREVLNGSDLSVWNSERSLFIEFLMVLTFESVVRLKKQS